MLDNLLNYNWFWFFGGFVTAGVLVSWGLYFLYERERKNIMSKFKKLIPNGTILKMDRNTLLLLKYCKLEGLYVADFYPRLKILGFSFEIIPDIKDDDEIEIELPEKEVKG